MRLNERTILEQPRQLPDSDGAMILEFPFLVVDEATGNNRVYPRAVMEQALKTAQEKINKGFSFFSSDSHPASGMEVDKVSHLVTKVFLEKNRVMARISILPTTRGRNVQTIIKAGGKLGVSARGEGGTVSENGKERVTSYDFQGVDFCLNPAAGTYVGKESLCESAPLDMDSQNLPDEILEARFYAARREAGYRGTWEAYRKIARREK